MIVRRYLAWRGSAPPEARAAATAALAKAFLQSDMEAEERFEAEAALTLALDDDAVEVRVALAETLAGSRAAPRHLVLALAADRSGAAAITLARSPLLTDAELIEHAALGDQAAQVAIAGREHLSAPVAAALAEVAEAPAALALLGNAAAELPPFSLTRIVERFGADPEIRAAVLERDRLPVEVRFAALLAARRETVTEPPGTRREQALRDEEERVAVSLATACGDDDLVELVRRLRTAGRLTAGLLLRSLLCGDLRLTGAALAELADMSARRVAGLMDEPRSGGWRALYRKAGMPEGLTEAFASAIAACRAATESFGGFGHGPVLARRIVTDVLRDFEAQHGAAAERIVALLRRYEVEFARDEARLATAMLMERISAEQNAPLALPAPANLPDEVNAATSAVSERLPPNLMSALEEALLRPSDVDEPTEPTPLNAEDAAPLVLRGTLADLTPEPDAPPPVSPLDAGNDRTFIPAGRLALAAGWGTQTLRGRIVETPAHTDLLPQPVSIAAEETAPAAPEPVAPDEQAAEIIAVEPSALTDEQRAMKRVEEIVAQAFADAMRARAA